MVKSAGICLIIIGGLIVFTQGMTIANRTPPDPIELQYCTTGTVYPCPDPCPPPRSCYEVEYELYSQQQTGSIIWLCAGVAGIVLGLIAIVKATSQEARQKMEREKTATENKIRGLEEKVKKLEGRKIETPPSNQQFGSG